MEVTQGEEGLVFFLFFHPELRTQGVAMWGGKWSQLALSRNLPEGLEELKTGRDKAEQTANRWATDGTHVTC